MHTTLHGTLFAALLGLAASAAAQDEAERTPVQKILGKSENIAFVDVTVYVGDGKKLDGVDVLVEDGKFKAIGKDLDVPPSFRRIDGGVLAPGLVLAGSTSGQASSRRAPAQRVIIRRRGRRIRRPSRTRGSSRATFSPTTKITSKLKHDSQDWADMLRGGVTTHGVRPTASGFSGLGGVVRPVGDKTADMVIDDDTFLWLGMARNTATKKMIRDNFKKAAAMIEARKAAKKKAAAKTPAKAPEKAPAKKPAKKPAPKPAKKPAPKTPPKKEAPKQAKPKLAAKAQAKPKTKPKAPREDPRIAILAKALEKKLPVVLGVSGAGDLVQALDAFGDTQLSLILYNVFRAGAQDTLDRVIPALKKAKVKVIGPVEFGRQPYTAYLSNPILKLERAGIPVVLVPGNRKNDLKTLWYRMGRLARTGIPAAKLVESVTLEPAKLLGVDKRVGSITKGKDANLIHFSRDPFSPAARVINVYLEGREVTAVPTRH